MELAGCEGGHGEGGGTRMTGGRKRTNTRRGASEAEDSTARCAITALLRAPRPPAPAGVVPSRPSARHLLHFLAPPPIPCPPFYALRIRQRLTFLLCISAPYSPFSSAHLHVPGGPPRPQRRRTSPLCPTPVCSRRVVSPLPWPFPWGSVIFLGGVAVEFPFCVVVSLQSVVVGLANFLAVCVCDQLWVKVGRGVAPGELGTCREGKSECEGGGGREFGNSCL